MDSKFEECLQACIDCLEACNRCYDACLREEDVNMMAECIRLDRECASICMYTIDALTRQSPFDKKIVLLCAEICERCAIECAKHHHTHCQECAEACRKCAEACRALVA